MSSEDSNKLKKHCPKNWNDIEPITLEDLNTYELKDLVRLPSGHCILHDSFTKIVTTANEAGVRPINPLTREPLSVEFIAKQAKATPETRSIINRAVNLFTSSGLARDMAMNFALTLMGMGLLYGSLSSLAYPPSDDFGGKRKKPSKKKLSKKRKHNRRNKITKKRTIKKTPFKMNISEKTYKKLLDMKKNKKKLSKFQQRNLDKALHYK